MRLRNLLSAGLLLTLSGVALSGCAYDAGYGGGGYYDGGGSSGYPSGYYNGDSGGYPSGGYPGGGYQGGYQGYYGSPYGPGSPYVSGPLYGWYGYGDDDDDWDGGHHHKKHHDHDNDGDHGNGGWQGGNQPWQPRGPGHDGPRNWCRPSDPGCPKGNWPQQGNWPQGNGNGQQGHNTPWPNQVHNNQGQNQGQQPRGGGNGAWVYKTPAQPDGSGAPAFQPRNNDNRPRCGMNGLPPCPR
jgi:hypothetical protein